MTRNPSGDRRPRNSGKQQPAARRNKREAEKVRAVTVQPEMREKEKSANNEAAGGESALDLEVKAAAAVAINSSNTAADVLEAVNICANAIVEAAETTENYCSVVEVGKAGENYFNAINEDARKNNSNAIVEAAETTENYFSVVEVGKAGENYFNAINEAAETTENYFSVVEVGKAGENYFNAINEDARKNNSNAIIEAAETTENYFSVVEVGKAGDNYFNAINEDVRKNNSNAIIEEGVEKMSNAVVEEAVEKSSGRVVEVGKDVAADRAKEREVSEARRSEDPIGTVKLMQCGSLEIDEERQRRVAMMESLCQVNGSSASSTSSSSASSTSSSSSSSSSISSNSGSISSASSTKSTKSTSSITTNGSGGTSSSSSTGGGGGVNNSSKCHRDANNEYADPQQRLAVLSFEQVRRLNDVMNEVVSIHGRGNFPTLEVRLRDLVTVVRSKLEEDPSNGGAGMRVRDIRLNGGAASHVLATESQPYNDLDLIFAVELTSGRNYDRVKAAVLGSLFDLLPEGVSRKRITTCSLKEAYVSKMVKVNNDGDRWSLISLGNSRGHRNVELKFVDTMRRQFEFSVDSFQIVLDSLLLFYECSKLPIGENFYPTVVGESVYGDFQEALYHLHKKLISTRHPEEIRGGGLLKYCNLLVKMYKASQPDYIKTLERYMCSRFFIDFPDVGQQQAKLENYLWNHFVGPEEEALKYQYLMLLHSVVEESTVCLMGHERRQTLALIENLAFQVLCQEQQRLNSQHQQQPPPGPQPTYVYANGYANGYYYAPVIPTACYTCTCTSWMACSS